MTFNEKITEYESEGYEFRYETCQNVIFQFDDKFEEKCHKIMELFVSCLNQINDLLKRTGEAFTNFSLIVLKDDLIKYKKVLDYIFKNIKTVLNFVKGFEYIDEKLSKFYKIIENFNRKEKIDFFQACEILAQNSLDLSKIYFKIFTDSKNLSENFNLLTCLNLEIPIDPYFMIKQLIIEKYNQAFKELNGKATIPIATDSESKTIATENIFYLEVVDNIDEKQDNSLIIENVYLSNASYDLVTKSFVSSCKKMQTKIPLAKLTPMIDIDNGKQDAFKRVPLIDHEKGDIVCMFGIKFWHNSNSSLSSTWTQETEEKRANSANKLNISTPLHYPIYFHIKSLSHFFLNSTI